jgi:hypothetical protein
VNDYPYSKKTGTPSSAAQPSSQICPVAFGVLFVTIPITPSQPLIFVRHIDFQSESQGCFTDMSTNSKGLASFFAWPTNKVLKLASSIAKLMNMRFDFVTGFLFSQIEFYKFLYHTGKLIQQTRTAM